MRMVRLGQTKEYTAQDPLIEKTQNMLIDKFRIANAEHMVTKMVKINRTTVVVSDGNLSRNEFDYFIKRLKEKQARSQIRTVMNKIIQLSATMDSVVLISPFLWNLNDFNLSGLDIKRTDWSMRTIKVSTTINRTKTKSGFLTTVVGKGSQDSTESACIEVA
jgi:hypothetical protein